MPKMSMCSCKIKLRNDHRTEVYRERWNPVSWPELMMLEHAHGKHAISDVKIVGEVETNGQEEEERLLNIYGTKLYKTVYPLPSPQFDWQAPKQIPRDVDTSVTVKPARRGSDDDPFEDAKAATG